MASPPDKAPFRFSLRALFAVTTLSALAIGMSSYDTNIAFSLAILAVTGLCFTIAIAFFRWASRTSEKTAMRMFNILICLGYSLFFAMVIVWGPDGFRVTRGDRFHPGLYLLAPGLALWSPSLYLLQRTSS